jgi:hypothetical protein
MAVEYCHTRDRQSDAHFSFEQQNNGSWSAYIVSQSDHGTQDTHTSATCRMTDEDRHRDVSWSHPPGSESETRVVAAVRADLTQTCTCNGDPIPVGAFNS